jgi:1-acyl-sn-glycerol-3-phosphate acyltransferase
MGGVKAVVRGREMLAPGQTYLFLSNHQGNLDAPIIICVADRELRAPFKKEMMRIPVLSLAMKKVGFLPIDRTNPARAHACLDEGAQMLKDGHSFFAFPEGTRSRDGCLGPFKKGVFHMALKAGVPIVPVSIKNTIAIQPRGTYAIRPGTVEVTFHDPIPTAQLQIGDRERLIEATRTAIATGLKGSGIRSQGR